MIFLDIPLLGILVILYALSFLFSLIKYANLSANESRLKQLAEDGNARAEKLIEFLDKHSRLMTASVKFFNAALVTAAGAISLFFIVNPVIVNHFPADIAFVILVVVVIWIYLLIGVFLPKGIAGKNSDKLAMTLLPLAKLITYIGAVFVFIPDLIAKALLAPFGVDPDEDNEDVTEEEIRMMVDIGSESGALDDDEKEMIHNIFEMDDKPVEEIMTHRTDAIILWLEDGADEWEKIINETNHTRYPVCGDAIDDVLGIINSRDFYRLMLKDRNADLKSIMREPYFVPDSIKADEIFSRMRDKNSHFAIVLDEYGGFRGILTQEDLIEEIVGELYSEYDEPEKEVEINRIPGEENSWLIDCVADIEDVEEALGVTIPDDDNYNTFAGLILDILGTVPADGDTPELEYGRMKIKVTKVEEHRIEEAIVTLSDEEDDTEEAGE